MEKLIQFALASFVLMFFQACNIYAGSKTQTLTVEKKLIGHYIYGHEVNSFQPCNQKNVFWVTGSKKILQLLEQKHREYTSQPYEEVFAEIIGSFVGKASDGFAMDYDGQNLVIRMLGMKKKSKSDCK